MKKLFLSILSILLIFVACNKVSDVAPTKASFLKDSPCTITTKMIAGGGKYDEKCTGTWVGNITVTDDGTNITVNYEITEPGWFIKETHLYIGPECEIPATNSGNPKVGHFTYVDEHDPAVSSFTYGPFPSPEEDYVIAAHAVVGGASSVSDFCGMLPETAHIVITPGHPDSYLHVAVTNGDWLNGEYGGWCIDADLGLSVKEFDADVYCSYEDLPEGLVEYPENMDLVNWILNNVAVGQSSTCDGNYTFGDIQYAIWSLVDDNLPPELNSLGPWEQCRADEIIADAQANGEGYEPGCGDVFGVIFDPNGDYQPSIIPVPMTCMGDETAWGYGKHDDACDQSDEAASGMSFTDSTCDEYGGHNWGWYFYGCSVDD